jgi:Ni/Co efflux regulator RcnB
MEDSTERRNIIHKREGIDLIKKYFLIWRAKKDQRTANKREYEPYQKVGRERKKIKNKWKRGLTYSPKNRKEFRNLEDYLLFSRAVSKSGKAEKCFFFRTGQEIEQIQKIKKRLY